MDRLLQVIQDVSRSRAVGKELQLKYVCVSMVKPVAVCGSEPWTVAEMDMRGLSTLQRKVLIRRVGGNQELTEL